MRVIFGNNDKEYRLISMRLYDGEGTKVANQAGVPQDNYIWSYQRALINMRGSNSNFLDVDENDNDNSRNIIVNYN